MTYSFDTLGYAKRLRDAGISSSQAEAHAEAARDFVMGELVTRYDLETLRREMDASIAAVRQDTEAGFAAVRQEAAAFKREVEVSFAAVRQDMIVLKREMDSALERVLLQMTVRLGGMVAVAVAILATILKLH